VPVTRNVNVNVPVRLRRDRRMLACACVGRDSAHIPAPRQVRVRPGPVAFGVSNPAKNETARGAAGCISPALVAFPTPTRLEIDTVIRVTREFGIRTRIRTSGRAVFDHESAAGTATHVLRSAHSAPCVVPAGPHARMVRSVGVCDPRSHRRNYMLACGL